MKIYTDLKNCLEEIGYDENLPSIVSDVPDDNAARDVIFATQKMFRDSKDFDFIDVINFQRLFGELLNNALASVVVGGGGEVEGIAYSGEKGSLYGTRQTSRFFNESQIEVILGGGLPQTTWNDEHGGEGLRFLCFSSDAILLDKEKKIIASVNNS